MAAQQILFAETIMGMKKAMARKDDGKSALLNTVSGVSR